MQPTLSLIIPAFNEARRLPPYLDEIRGYLNDELPKGYEVIVVDDGSNDDMPNIVEELASEWPELSMVRHTLNRGKGAAVVTGILRAQGAVVCFADADGATPIDQERKLRAAILAGADVAIGSRFAGVKRMWSRGIVGLAFAQLTRLLFGLPVHDTQCGFKMFRSAVGRELCQMATQQGFLLDVEILVLANQLGYRIGEIPVEWTDVAGSKVRLLRDGWKMFRGLWVLRSLHRRTTSPSRLACASKFVESGT